MFFVQTIGFDYIDDLGEHFVKTGNTHVFCDTTTIVSWLFVMLLPASYAGGTCCPCDAVAGQLCRWDIYIL